MSPWKFARTALAALMGMVFAMLLVLYLTAGHAALQMATVEATEQDFWSISRTAKRVLVVAGLLAAMLYMLGLMEQRKIVALYLRRFLKNTEVLNPQRSGGLGRSVRLITLQDRTFPPYAISKKETALSLLLPLALIAAVFVTTNVLNSQRV